MIKYNIYDIILYTNILYSSHSLPIHYFISSFFAGYSTFSSSLGKDDFGGLVKS